MDCCPLVPLVHTSRLVNRSHRRPSYLVVVEDTALLSRHVFFLGVSNLEDRKRGEVSRAVAQKISSE